MTNKISSNKGRRSVLPRLDKNVLLGVLAVMVILFIVTWAASREFMPGARLFPNFVAGLGLIVTLVAIVRVWLGIEPGQGLGQILPEQDESPWPVYRYAGIVLGGICVYYLGISLLGFLPATGIYLIVFLRIHKQSWRFTLIGTVLALIFVYAVSASLDLFLPWGLLERFI